MKKMVGFPKTKETVWNTMSDQDLWIVLAWINLIGVLIGSFGLWFLFLIFNWLYIYKWLNK